MFESANNLGMLLVLLMGVLVMVLAVFLCTNILAYCNAELAEDR